MRLLLRLSRRSATRDASIEARLFAVSDSGLTIATLLPDRSRETRLTKDLIGALRTIRAELTNELSCRLAAVKYYMHKNT